MTITASLLPKSGAYKPTLSLRVRDKTLEKLRALFGEERPRLGYQAQWLAVDRLQVMVYKDERGVLPFIPTRNRKNYVALAWGAGSDPAFRSRLFFMACETDGTITEVGPDYMVFTFNISRAETKAGRRGKKIKPPQKVKSAPTVQAKALAPPPATGKGAPITQRLSGLRDAFNHAIREAAEAGFLVQVHQSAPGELVSVSIDL